VACYIAKDRGRNQIQIHLPEDLEQERRRSEMQWSTRISTALKDNRLTLYFQRIASITATVPPHIDYELLVRLVDEHGAHVPPGRFLPAAERYQLMPDIDRWVVRNALRRLAHPGRSHYQGTFSINLSGQTLGDSDFLGYVRNEIRASGVDPARLCFEITETAAIRNLSRASQFMAELRRLGCLFALDDFGSGLSSFAYLKALPVDFLKIDGSFVRNIARDPSDRSLVAAIHQIAQVMGMRTIAEFIEDEATLAILRDLGVNYGQGYVLHVPEEVVIDADTTRGHLDTA
jgi:EAL domain-containing protein (putative c-di-GMP-specific phosphodiesterase class I)